MEKELRGRGVKGQDGKWDRDTERGLWGRVIRGWAGKGDEEKIKGKGEED